MLEYFEQPKIKPHISVISLDAYPKEIQNFLVRHYKYFYSFNQFCEDDDMDKIALARFINKTRTSKMIRSLMLKTNPSFSNVRVRSGSLKFILKTHCQSLKNLNVCDLPCFEAGFPTNFLQSIKNLKTLHVKTRKADLKGLCISRGLESISIDLKDSQLKISRLFNPLARLKNLKRLELLSYPANLSDAVELLNQLTAQRNKCLEIAIATSKGNEDYSRMPEIDGSLSKMVTQLNLECISTNASLSSVLPEFCNLRKLRLDFSVSDLSFMDYLQALSQMHFLEILLLNFGESCPKEFSTAMINNLRLPASLQEFEIEMPLFLEDYILNNDLIKDSKRRYSWREKNYFEEESSLQSFFKAFESTKSLKRFAFQCKMLEDFSSYYTNFFISILNRLPSLYSFVISARDKTVQKTIENPPDCFDLSLLFACCSKMPNLEGIEVVMPNLLFDDVELNFDLLKLKEFHIGISDQEENDVLSFSGISKHVEKLMKTLAWKAPNLKSLILDFREIINESAICRRFQLIEKLKNLEYLFLRVVIPECNSHTVQTVGNKLLALRKLRTLVLHFNNSDPNTFSMHNFIDYHKSIREILFISNDKVWLGRDCLNDMDFNIIE